MTNLDEKHRFPVDARLDHLYMSAVRCPYCHTLIRKGMDVCPNCGISKAQLYHAQLAGRGAKHRKIYSRIRPDTIPMWQMVVAGVFGFTGAHCFRARRYWRGALLLTCLIAAIVVSIVFPIAVPELGIAEHPWRTMFRQKTYPFPGDIFIAVVGVLWIFDFFTIVCGRFKYPVVLLPDRPVEK